MRLILFISLPIFLMAQESIQSLLFQSLNDPWLFAFALVLGFLNTQYLAWAFSLLFALFYSVFDGSIADHKEIIYMIEILLIRFTTIILVYYLVNVIKRSFWDKRFGDLSRVNEE